MKKLRFSLSCLLALFLMFASTSPIFATQESSVKYTALGDSIAYGIGASFDAGDPPALNGYTNMLKDHLIRTHGEVIYNNLAVSGLTSMELLWGLSDPAAQFFVEQSDIITISIGGNDLLYPFMLSLLTFLINNYYYEGKLNIEEFMMEFEAWKLDPMNEEYLHFNAFFAELPTVFENAVPGFEENWATIIFGIRSLNEDADIYVNTVYNPFSNDPILHGIIDSYVKDLNEFIVSNASIYSYEVVDVYTEFENYGNPKKLAVGDLSNLADFVSNENVVIDMSPVPLHPTDLGYRFIFNLHKDLME